MPANPYKVRLAVAPVPVPLLYIFADLFND
jgi:hypothetical protein